MLTRPTAAGGTFLAEPSLWGSWDRSGYRRTNGLPRNERAKDAVHGRYLSRQTRRRSGGATLVPMMESAHLRSCDDPPSLRWLDGAWLWRVLVQAQVRPTPMIIAQEPLQVAVQGAFVKHNQPSRPGDLHPEALTEPDISLSTYPARATE